MQLRQNENQLAMLKTSLLNTIHIACHKKEQLHFKSKFSEIEYLTCRVYASAFYFAPHKIHKIHAFSKHEIYFAAVSKADINREASQHCDIPVLLTVF